MTDPVTIERELIKASIAALSQSSLIFTTLTLTSTDQEDRRLYAAISDMDHSCARQLEEAL